jgi:hypothetical protein
MVEVSYFVTQSLNYVAAGLPRRHITLYAVVISRPNASNQSVMRRYRLPSFPTGSGPVFRENNVLTPDPWGPRGDAKLVVSG